MNIVRKIWGVKGAEMTTPDLFMPEWDRDPNEEREPIRQTTEQQKEIWLAIADLQNKKVKKQKERDSKLSKRPSKLKDKK
jgi:hypothetical protein